MKTSALLIRTPEGIVFAQELAGPIARFLAWLVDQACIIASTQVLGVALRAVGLLSPSLAQTFFILTYFILSLGYGMACEWWWRGQTLGKRVLRLRVMDAEGLRLHFPQIVIRNLLRAVDVLPVAYFLGGVVCWCSAKGQRLGDIAANTIVVRHPKIIEPDLGQLLAGKYNSLRLHPHLAARLRQRVSPGEASVALQAIFRRDEFEPLARVELFAELAQHFRAKVDFPAEVCAGITDEQYMRNVVDVVYRQQAQPPIMRH